jgi:hypothetical protein
MSAPYRSRLVRLLAVGLIVVGFACSADPTFAARLGKREIEIVKQIPYWARRAVELLPHRPASLSPQPIIGLDSDRAHRSWPYGR